MNAYELAKKLEWYSNYPEFVEAGELLRQQADRIAHLEMLVANRNEIIDKLDLTKPQIKELSDEEIKPLLDRIQNYLKCGGFFNPECMEHDKAKDLIMDCRAILKKASEK